VAERKASSSGTQRRMEGSLLLSGRYSSGIG
jgi:hypothetical protein